MAKREFMQLAHTFNPMKHGVAGWWYSEKLDGMRCYWDGGITRAMLKSDVPWANTVKDDRYVEEPIATGLWSRYGNVIHAPDSWLNSLPDMPLDGELHWYDMSHRPRQELMSIVKTHVPDACEWERVNMFCFGIPAYETIFEDGIIDNVNYKKTFNGIQTWLEGRLDNIICPSSPLRRFETQYHIMKKYLGTDIDCTARVLQQWTLPYNTTLAIKKLEYCLQGVISFGGEGLMVRNPNAVWVPERSHTLLKIKERDDAEGIVVGYITGRIGKEGRLHGKMGALILELDDGNRLELSGFTDAERELTVDDPDLTTYHAREWAKANPETECPTWIEAGHFLRGSRVTFKYRGKSKDGVPQEAAYYRKDERL